MHATQNKQTSKLIPLFRFYSPDIFICPIVATAIVTKNEALLWTDARYWIQAEQQMDCNWLLMKEGTIDEERDPNDPGMENVFFSLF